MPRIILTIEGDVGTILGIDIKTHPDRKLELVQPGLIKKISAECSLQDNLHTHDTPAETKILQRDFGGTSHDLSWNYRSIIGMLTYLSVTSRPDIAYAVHLCTCFSTSPKCSHELAIRCIIRYLKGAADKGYFLQPTAKKTLDYYIDTDFAGELDTTNISRSSISLVQDRICDTFCSLPLTLGIKTTNRTLGTSTTYSMVFLVLATLQSNITISNNMFF